MITVKNREDFLRALMMYLPSNPVCVELGVLHGDFSKMILDILNPSKLVLVDPYITYAEGERYGSELDYLPKAYSTPEQYQELLKRFEKEISLKQVFVEKKFSYEVVDCFPIRHFDCFYQDASHLYNDVRRDLNDWLPNVKESGQICGHDYREFSNFGVIQAVDEFCKEHNFEMIIFNENGGDYALRKKMPGFTDKLLETK